MTAETIRERAVEIKRRIFKIERLAAMPHVVNELLTALTDEYVSPDRLEKIVRSDPALAAKLISLANSSYYGLASKVTTIARAIVVIGFNELQILALGAGLAEVFDLKKAPRGFNGPALWAHCLAVSWTARELALATGRVSPGEAMFSGLIHDLGKLVLATHFKEEFAAMTVEIERGRPYYEVEEELGLPHTEVGYWLAHRWNLPEVHAEVIRDHHSPSPNAEMGGHVRLVALADALVKKLGCGIVQESRRLPVQGLLDGLFLTPDEFRVVAHRAKDRLPDVLSVWTSVT